MICAGCHTYVGSPCACCRTLGRLRFLIERGNLPLDKEQEILTALRSAAGVVADIVEVYGFKNTGAAPARGGGGEKPLESEGAKTEAASSKKEAVSSEVIASAKKRAKKDSQKEKRRDKEASGVEETPVAGGRPREDLREPIRRRDIERKSKPSEEERRHRGERLQEEVDTYVETRPQSFGLGNIPVRGTAAKHFANQADRGRERPPEPEGPPPIPRRRQERSRTPQKKKSKGKKHRQRGRDYWKGVRARQR